MEKGWKYVGGIRIYKYSFLLSGAIAM